MMSKAPKLHAKKVSLERDIDRERARRVGSYVPRFRTISALICAATLAAMPACGGKDKGAKTPADGDKDPTGMTGSKADGSGAVTPGDGSSAGSGNGDGATAGNGDGATAGNGDGATAGEDPLDQEPPPPPKVEPPVADISDQAAARQVKGHIATARSALRGKRDLDGVIRACKEALAIDANNLDAVVLMAHAYYYKKLYATADVILIRALSSPNKKISNRANKSAYLFYVRGLVYDASDRGEEAQLAYEEAYKRNTKHKSTMLNLGVHYIRDSRYAEAQELFQELLRMGLRTPAVHTNLGSSLRGRSASQSISKVQRDKYLSGAERSYKRAIQDNKNYAAAYYNLGLLYMDAKPFPLDASSMPGKYLQELKRLERSKTEFDTYRSLPGADIPRVDESLRQVAKATKRELKRIKKAKKAAAKKKKKTDDDW